METTKKTRLFRATDIEPTTKELFDMTEEQQTYWIRMILSYSQLRDDLYCIFAKERGGIFVGPFCYPCSQPKYIQEIDKAWK